MRTASGFLAMALLTLVASPAAAQVSIGVGRTQAESMTMTNYETNTFQDVVNAGATGTTLGNVRGVFTGASGTYDITIRYMDEDDGQATLTLKIAGTTVDSFVLNADDLMWHTRTTPGVFIASGAEVRIEGAWNSGEHDRIDYIDINTQGPPPTGCVRTVNVSSSSALNTAVAGAQPGDCIVLANGNYSAFTITADGTSSLPITISAANRGSATINSGILRLNGANWVVLDGLKITSSGGTTTLDGESRQVIVSIAGSNNCRLTRLTFRPTGHAAKTAFVMLNGNSTNNRIDHSDFGPNTVDGVHYVWPAGNKTIPGVTPPSDRTDWANYHSPVNPNIARGTMIDHNYFHDMASGTAECMVLGGLGVTGDYQDTNTVVENNLFTNCDGDPEIISIKSSSNIVRYNTIRTSAGGIVSRAGNKNQIYGNFILQGGKDGSAGIRLHEKDHTVYNNYIENTQDYPFNIASGDAYTDPDFVHAQVFRAHVIHNTIALLNGRPLIVGWGSNALAPVDCVVANNILDGNATLLSLPLPGNTTFSNNIAHGTLGASRSASEFRLIDPLFTTSNGLQKLTASSPAIGFANPTFYPFVTDDMDGQPRTSPDTGADEFSTATITRRPLTTADVGPNAP